MLDDETCRHCGGVDNWHHDLTECVGRLKSELALARKALAAAKNLLAVLHRDGGHHTERVGFEQSCSDAEKSFPWVLAALDAAEEMRDSLTIESFALPRQCENIAAFDAAMAEVRKGEG